MWIKIKEKLYNLNHYYMISKDLDECESYQSFVIKLHYKSRDKNFNYQRFEYKAESKRDEEFNKILYNLLEQ